MVTRPRRAAAAAAALVLAVLAGCAPSGGESTPEAPPAPESSYESTPGAPPVSDATPGASAPAPESSYESTPEAVPLPLPRGTLGVAVGDAVLADVVESIVWSAAEPVISPRTRTGFAQVTGLPGQQALVFACHAGGDSVCTPLTDRGSGTPAVAPGDPLEVGGLVAEIVSATVVPKGQAWDALAAAVTDPGAVVVVTCRPEGTPSSANNVIITARWVSPPEPAP